MAFTRDRSATVTMTLLNDLWGLLKTKAAESTPASINGNFPGAPRIADMTINETDDLAFDVTDDVYSLLVVFFQKLRARNIGGYRLSTTATGTNLEISSTAGVTYLAPSPTIAKGSRAGWDAWTTQAIVGLSNALVGRVDWTTDGDTPGVSSKRVAWMEAREDFGGWGYAIGTYSYSEDYFRFWSSAYNPAPGILGAAKPYQDVFTGDGNTSAYTLSHRIARTEWRQGVWAARNGQLLEQKASPADTSEYSVTDDGVNTTVTLGGLLGLNEVLLVIYWA